MAPTRRTILVDGCWLWLCLMFFIVLFVYPFYPVASLSSCSFNTEIWVASTCALWPLSQVRCVESMFWRRGSLPDSLDSWKSIISDIQWSMWSMNSNIFQHHSNTNFWLSSGLLAEGLPGSSVKQQPAPASQETVLIVREQTQDQAGMTDVVPWTL